MTSASSLSPRLGEGAGVQAGHRREVHRRQHAVGVHVPHPLVHVEAARAQLGVRARVEAPLLVGPADGGGHPERRGGRLALEHPLVDALRRCGRPWAPRPATSPGRGSRTCRAARRSGRRCSPGSCRPSACAGSSRIWTWPKTLATNAGSRRGRREPEEQGRAHRATRASACWARACRRGAHGCEPFGQRVHRVRSVARTAVAAEVDPATSASSRAKAPDATST